MDFTIMHYVAWALIGWSGITQTHWPPKKNTDPIPWYTPRVLGILGGMAGGYLLTDASGGDLLFGAVGAFALGKIFVDLVEKIRHPLVKTT